MCSGSEEGSYSRLIDFCITEGRSQAKRDAQAVEGEVDLEGVACGGRRLLQARVHLVVVALRV